MVVPLVNDVLLSLTAEQNESFIIKCVVNDGEVALWVPLQTAKLGIEALGKMRSMGNFFQLPGGS